MGTEPNGVLSVAPRYRKPNITNKQECSFNTIFWSKIRSRSVTYNEDFHCSKIIKYNFYNIQKSAFTMENQQPAPADISIEKAKTLQEQERYDEALEIYNELIRLKPDNQDAYYNKALCLDTQGKFQEAQLSLKEVLQLDPSHPLAFGIIGKLFLKMDQMKFAKPTFERQLKVCPTSLPSILYLAKLQLEEDQTGREFIESTAGVKSWLLGLPSDERTVKIKDFKVTLSDVEMDILKNIKEMLHLFSELTTNPAINQNDTMKRFYEIDSEIKELKLFN